MVDYNQLAGMDETGLKDVVRWSNGLINERAYRKGQKALTGLSRLDIFLEEINLLLTISGEKSVITRSKWEELYTTLKGLIPDRVDDLFASTLEFEARLHQFGADKGIEPSAYEGLFGRCTSMLYTD